MRVASVMVSAAAAPAAWRYERMGGGGAILPVGRSAAWRERLAMATGGGRCVASIPVRRRAAGRFWAVRPDRKSTRLNSSHSQISYAVFCLKKKHDTQHGALPEPPQHRAALSASFHPPHRANGVHPHLALMRPRPPDKPAVTIGLHHRRTRR